MTATMDTLSLADRLRDAEAAEQPLAARMAELRAQLSDAVQRSDYTTAGTAKAEIEALQGEWAIAHANAEALRGAIAELDKQRQSVELAIQEQQHRDAARLELAAAQPAEQAALEELGALVAQARVGLLAVRQTIEKALVAEQTAHECRIRCYHAQVQLGDRPNGQRVPRPNNMSALLESDRVMRAVAGRAF